jgi:hypothetical protein
MAWLKVLGKSASKTKQSWKINKKGIPLDANLIGIP